MIAQQFSFWTTERLRFEVFETWRHTSPTQNQLVAYYVKLRKDHSILGSAVTVTRAAQAHREIQHGSSTVSRLQYSGKF